MAAVAAAVVAWDTQDMDTAEEHHPRGVGMDNKMEAAASSLPLPSRPLVDAVGWENGRSWDSTEAAVRESGIVRGEE